MTGLSEKSESPFFVGFFSNIFEIITPKLLAEVETMGQVEQIESQIAALPAPDLRTFRAWFSEFDAGQWDCQLKSDIADGRLEDLAAEALAQFGKGQCKRL